MCKKNHDWVTVYQDGGFYVMCAKCGMATEWQPNSARGHGCVAIPALMFACVFPAFVAWIIAKELWNQATADIVSAVVYLAVLAVAICLCAMPKAPKLTKVEDVE